MSYAIINQRLIGIQLFEHPTDVLRLVPYFYKESTDIINEPKKEVINEPKKEVIKKPMKLNLPQDTLFWNIYISVYGVSEYKLIGSKFTNIEWNEKNNI